MPYVVTQACCADASCVVACPVNCIHPAPGEPGFAEAEMVYVDPATCVDCGACATACPVDAIVPHTTLTPAQEPFAALNADYFAAFPHADRTPLALVPAQRRLRRPGPFRLAVIGAGPAGLYAADELLRHPEVSVDVFDRLSTPHGLVRAGVAPDHPATRQVEELFTAIEQQPRFRYVLGVEVGEPGCPVDRAWLEQRYHGVVWATGASADRSMGVPGEELPGSLSATELVRWYNGHPDGAGLDVDLGHPVSESGRVVVVGNGNVALDVARILTVPADDLARTDIADHALVSLRHSEVREVVVLGRRGPAEAAYTLPELVGLSGLADDGVVDVCVDTGGAPLPDGEAGRLLARMHHAVPRAGARRLVLRFLTVPVRVVGDGRVTGLEVARTRLVERDGRTVAEATGETEVVEAGLVLRSVGYRVQPVPGLPWDGAAGGVPHVAGRVAPGLYVAGWLKRGPTGFIGTNKTCAAETVEQILDDLDSGAAPQPGRDADQVTADLRHDLPDHVDGAGWAAIDAEERRRGSLVGRPRVKVTDPAELLRLVTGGPRTGDRRLGRRGYAARSAGRRTRELVTRS